jgi:hypothetical protein
MRDSMRKKRKGKIIAFNDHCHCYNRILGLVKYNEKSFIWFTVLEAGKINTRGLHLLSFCEDHVLLSLTEGSRRTRQHRCRRKGSQTPGLTHSCRKSTNPYIKALPHHQTLPARPLLPILPPWGPSEF